MPSIVPAAWHSVLPHSLVVGKEGAFARALALIFDAAYAHPEALSDGPEPDDSGRFPKVLGELVCVFIVVSETMSAAEALRGHDTVWRWVERLAPAGEEHELAFVFILPPENTDSLVSALAVGLGLRAFAPPNEGYAVWRSSEALDSLLDLLPRVRRRDLPPLRARLKAEAKHAILSKLRDATSRGDATLVREAASEVVREFSGNDYLLDIFCRHPSHRNGNLLRSWLRNVVTDSVTPNCEDNQLFLSQWLK